MSPDEQLKAAIQARAHAASPGPWEVSTNRDCPPEVWSYAEEVSNAYSSGDMIFGDSADGYMIRSKADLIFIAHARTDVPWLLKALTDAEAQRAMVETQYQRERKLYQDAEDHCDRLIERLVEANRKLEAAPHTDVCSSFVRSDQKCDCWKASTVPVVLDTKEGE